jgi:two-component system cell cycle sensor histidine kinase/response regulator CckA
MSKRDLQSLVGSTEGAVLVGSGVAVFEAVDQGRDFVVAELDRGAARVDGLPYEAVGRRLTEVIPEAESSGLLEVLRLVYHDGQPRALGDRRAAGDVWVRSQVFRLPSGRLVIVHEDVSDRRQLQASLAQADRMASVGLLAAGVAHEINNPLTYVLYNLDALSQDLPQLADALARAARALGDRAEEVLGDAHEMCAADRLEDLIQQAEDATDGAVRVRRIVKDLRTFSRTEEDRSVPVSLNDVIDSAINMAFNEIKYRARLVKDYGKLPTIVANDGKLAQVFLNLLVNAAQSIEEGDVSGNQIRIRTWVEGERLLAEVADSGKGIDAKLLDKIFDPFFSTKEVGEGSGLGLAICRNIIEAQGGEITVASKPGEGTRFTIRLPLHREREQSATRRPRYPTPEPMGGGRLLVVDDEAHVARAMKHLLGTEHEVLAVTSGEAAKVLLSCDQRFDVIVCDLMMPEVTGMDLHRWVAEQYPELATRMIFVTGGAFTPKAREFLARVDNPRLEKPFDPRSLQAWLRRMINDRLRSREPPTHT